MTDKKIIVYHTENEAGIPKKSEGKNDDFRQTRENGKDYGLARWIILACIAVFVVLVFVLGTGSSRPFEDVKTAVESTLDSSKLTNTGSSGLKRYYGLEAAEYEGVMLYTSTHPMSAEEVLIIKAASDSQVRDLEDALARRIDDKLTEFGTYAPEQTALIKNAVVLTRGKYVFLAVSQDADRYRKAFTKAL